MSDKAIYSVDTVETITDNDKIYVNTGDNIKQIKSSDLFIDINSNLDDYGLLNKFDGKWEQGIIDYQSGEDKSSTSSVRTPTFYNVDNNGFVSIEVSETYAWIGFRFFDVNKNYIKEESVQNATKLESKAPSNAKYVRFVLQEGYDFTPSNVGKTIIYIDNEIDKLKNDLTFNEIQTISATQGTFKYRLNGNLCEYWFNGTDTTSSIVTIGTLPVHPVEQFTEPLTGKNGGCLTIASNGIVKVALSDAYGSTHGMFSY